MSTKFNRAPTRFHTFHVTHLWGRLRGSGKVADNPKWPKIVTEIGHALWYGQPCDPKSRLHATPFENSSPPPIAYSVALLQSFSFGRTAIDVSPYQAFFLATTFSVAVRSSFFPARGSQIGRQLNSCFWPSGVLMFTLATRLATQ